MGQNENQGVALLFLAAVVLVGLIWKFARYIGADFEITFYATMKTIGVLGACGFFYYAFRPRIRMLIIGGLVAAWPMWWGVIDSIACSGAGDSLEMMEIVRATTGDVWWNSFWFKGGIEAAGIITAATILLKSD